MCIISYITLTSWPARSEQPRVKYEDSDLISKPILQFHTSMVKIGDIRDKKTKSSLVEDRLNVRIPHVITLSNMQFSEEKIFKNCVGS